MAPQQAEPSNTLPPATTQIPLPSPPPTATPIPDTILRAVHASDQDMYPVALSYDRLRALVDASPDLSICFHSRTRDIGSDNDNKEEDGGDTPAPPGRPRPAAAAGVVVVLPLRRRHWEDLLAGRLKEPEIDPAVMFPTGAITPVDADDGMSAGGAGEVEEVGLHVYHIERFGSANWAVEEVGGPGGEGVEAVGGRVTQMRTAPFSEYALAEVMGRAGRRSEWRVIGLSALTATLAGKKTFQRLGFTPTGYREMFIVNSPDRESANEERVEMICLYPGDDDQAEKAVDGRMVLPISEMTVKYSSSGVSSLMDTLV